MVLIIDRTAELAEIAACNETIRVALERICELQAENNKLRALLAEYDAAKANTESFDDKTARNKRVAARYDQLRTEGKHGHYESMFRVVREECELAAAKASGSEGFRTDLENAPRNGVQVLIYTKNGTKQLCHWNGAWAYTGGSWPANWSDLHGWFLPPTPPSRTTDT